MKQKTDEEILREYISQTLKESNGYASSYNVADLGGFGNLAMIDRGMMGTGRDMFGGMDYSRSSEFGGLGWGAHSGGFGAEGDFEKVFVKPFSDLLGVIAGKTKEVMRRAITVAQVAFETFMTTFIPFLTDSYDEIFAAEAQDLQQIESEYSSYYQASAEALGGGPTALAMLAFPGPALLATTLSRGPAATKSILGVATGGLSDRYLEGTSDPKGNRIFDSHVKNYVKIILEDEDKEGNKNSKKEQQKEKTLASKLANKKFIDAMISKSPMINAASKEAQEIYKKTLEAAYQEARKVLTARDLSTIQRAVGKKIENVEELEQLTGTERDRAEQRLLSTIKQSAKKVYIARLMSQVAPVVKQFGLNHPFVVDYQATIDKIKSL